MCTYMLFWSMQLENKNPLKSNRNRPSYFKVKKFTIDAQDFQILNCEVKSLENSFVAYVAHSLYFIKG